MTASLRLPLVTFLLLAPSFAVRAQPKLEVMPGVGLGQMTGEATDELDVGPGFFLSLGTRLHPRYSLRAQLSGDGPGIDVDFPGADLRSGYGGPS